MSHDYSHYTDNEILVFSRKGEDAATDFLLEKYKPLVRKKARTLFLIGGENDDLIQEGMIALYKAIREYDGNHESSSSFARFAGTCIEHQLYNVIKGANRLKNSPLNSYISLYSPTETRDSSSTQTLADTLQPLELINPEDILIDQENVTHLEKAMEEHLSSFEQSVVQLYIDGNNYQQIAKLLGKPAKSVDNALQRAKKKLEKAVNGI